MISYDSIKSANGTIKTTPISRKDKDGNVVVKQYAEVNERIKAFRMCYPTGTIRTEIVSNENGICIFSAEVGYTDENNNYCVLGTGTAYEKENSSFINRTSYIENCETSSVGRALGMAGFGIDTSVASLEEVQNAMQNQAVDVPEEKKASVKQIEVLKNAYTGENLKKLLNAQKVEKLEDITMKNASVLIGKLKER